MVFVAILFSGCTKKPPPPVEVLPEEKIVGLAEEVKLVKNARDKEHIKDWNSGEVCYLEGIVHCPQPLGDGRALRMDTSCRIKGRWVIDFNKVGMIIDDLGNDQYRVSRQFTIPGLETGPHKATISYKGKELGSVDFVINEPK